MNAFAVTGSSGALGRLAVHALLARGVVADQVVALARTPSKVDDLRQLGVRVRAADYDDPSSLVEGLQDVDRLLLVSSSVAGKRVQHHTNVVEAAGATGVSRIGYTSMLNADTSTNPLAGEHRDTERLLRAQRVPWVFLRNGWYTENYTGQLATYVSAGEIVGAAGHGAVSAATRDDLADAAAVALIGDDENRVYELGGPAFTLDDLADAVSQVTGVAVRYRDLSTTDYVQHLQTAGTPEDTARFVAALDASVAHGDLQTDSRDLADLIARPPVDLVAALRRAQDAVSR